MKWEDPFVDPTAAILELQQEFVKLIDGGFEEFSSLESQIVDLMGEIDKYRLRVIDRDAEIEKLKLQIKRSKT